MRAQGRAGIWMIIGVALAAVTVLALLRTAFGKDSLEARMNDAAEVLAARQDADSLAAAGVLTHHQPDRSRSLIAQATRVAPERADLAWLHIQSCAAAASCDAEELDARLQDLDGDNGVGWFGALVRATQRGDGQARDSALAAIGQSGRMDLYWNPLVARLSRQIASTGMVSSYEAQIETIGRLAGYAIPALQHLSRACTGERLMQDDVTEVCGGVIRSLLNSDTVIIESMGTSLARQVLADDSPEHVEATEAQRTWDHRVQFAGDVSAWIQSHPQEHLDLLEQHRREQDVFEAVLIAAGRNPDPPIGQ